MTTKNIPEFDWDKLKEIREKIEDEPFNEDELESISAEKLLNRVEKGDSHYYTKGGLDTLRKFAEKEKKRKRKKEMEKNNANESGL